MVESGIETWALPVGSGQRARQLSADPLAREGRFCLSVEGTLPGCRRSPAVLGSGGGFTLLRGAELRGRLVARYATARMLAKLAG